MLGFSHVLKPVKRQDLLEKLWKKMATTCFQQVQGLVLVKKYIGVRGTLHVVNAEDLPGDLGEHDHLFQGNKVFFRITEGSLLHPEANPCFCCIVPHLNKQNPNPFPPYSLTCTQGSKRTL